MADTREGPPLVATGRMGPPFVNPGADEALDPAEARVVESTVGPMLGTGSSDAFVKKRKEMEISESRDVFESSWYDLHKEDFERTLRTCHDEHQKGFVPQWIEESESMLYLVFRRCTKDNETHVGKRATRRLADLAAGRKGAPCQVTCAEGDDDENKSPPSPAYSPTSPAYSPTSPAHSPAHE